MKITMKLSKTIVALCSGVSAMAMCGAAQAQIFYSSSSTISSWLGSPVYTSVSSANLSSCNTGQGDATITGTYGVMAEMFTPSSSFTLGSFAAILSVNNTSSTDYQIHLYDLGPAGTVSPTATTATYTPGTGATSSDLFSVNSISGLSSSGGSVQAIFALPAADQITLNANESYSIELWNPSAVGSAGITWIRLPSSTPSDPGGQMFTGGDGVAGARNTLAGNGQAGGAPRTAPLALYAVPEPSSLALVGAGIMMLGVIRRFKGK